MEALITDDLASLMAIAQRSRTRAYAPYSRFAVGAALRTASGEVFSGCNIENASYGLTLCAERVALASAVAAGSTQFAAIAIAGPPEVEIAPCGACRQTLAEFAARIVVAYGSAGAMRVTTLDMLLPDCFSLQT